MIQDIFKLLLSFRFSDVASLDPQAKAIPPFGVDKTEDIFVGNFVGGLTEEDLLKNRWAAKALLSFTPFTERAPTKPELRVVLRSFDLQNQVGTGRVMSSFASA